MFGYNTVESGYLKGGTVKFSLTNKPMIVKHGLLGKTKVILDKHNVFDYEVLEKYNAVGSTIYRCRIVFRNNRECTVNIHHSIHSAIINTIK